MFYVGIILAPIVFVWFVWKLLPRSAYLIRPKPNCYFHKNPDTLINTKKYLEIQNLIENIQALGFVKLGIKVEKQPLWGGSIKEVALASKDEQAFASIFVSSRRDVTYYYYTPFIEGQAVLTYSGGAILSVTSNELFQSVIASVKPDDLLSAHRKQVQLFNSKGLHPYQEYTQGSRIKATYQYFDTAPIRKTMRKTGLVYLALVIIGCAPIVYNLIQIIIS